MFEILFVVLVILSEATHFHLRLSFSTFLVTWQFFKF